MTQDNGSKTDQLVEEIKNLKIKVAGIEAFLESMPKAEDYLSYKYNEYVPGTVSDRVYNQALKVIEKTELVSANQLQRYLSIGFAMASKIIDRMEAEGLVAPSNDEKVRRVIRGD
jgi:DNA segregation ATPase FtsK/SpoIIIE-like protein